jgi:enoyl-CoA hydratase/3-hydroxyacyl-CoA dehydrogenase
LSSFFLSLTDFSLAMASRPTMRVAMEVGADGVALITICNPPVNALHPSSNQRPVPRRLR